MKDLQLDEMRAGWKRLSAPELVEEINRLRVLFAAEEKRLREEAGQTVFNSEVSYYKPLNALFDELNTRLINGEEITLHYDVYIDPEGPVINLEDIKVIPQTVQFTSDEDGNYYFDGKKVLVEYDREWAFKLRKKISTSYRRPVDFYLDFLDPKSKYTPEWNVFATTCKMICEKYKKR